MRARRMNSMGMRNLQMTVATAFFSPVKSGRIIWGAGPVLLLVKSGVLRRSGSASV
jgi:hypothetical protein